MLYWKLVAKDSQLFEFTWDRYEDDYANRNILN